VGFTSQKTFSARLHVVESDTKTNPDFITKLSLATGHSLQRFNTLKSALSADAPHIILADFRTIGDADAITTLRARFGVPIIVLSDRPSMASAVQAMRAGACDFFPKPASVSAITERINGLLAQSAVHSNRIDLAPGVPPLITPFWEQERDIIETALDACNGNISRAAAALQISPSTIYRKKQTWDERLKIGG